MPFTPFHFGLGLATKAVLERKFSLLLFLILQVVIDLESLYNLAYERDPVHRFLHTFVGATLLGMMASALLYLTVRRRAPSPGPRNPRLAVLLLSTCLFATWSHVVLDAILHRDVQPFWPVTDRNPLLSVIGVGGLHLACLTLGFFGLVALAFQWSLREHEA